MKNRFKKYLASLLTVVMLLSMLPASVLADDMVEQISAVEATAEPTEAIVVDATTEPADETTTENTVTPTMEPIVESADEATAEAVADSIVEPTNKTTEDLTIENPDDASTGLIVEITTEKNSEPSTEAVMDEEEDSADVLTVESIEDNLHPATALELAELIGLSIQETAEIWEMSVEDLNNLNASEIYQLYSELQIQMQQTAVMSATDTIYFTSHEDYEWVSSGEEVTVSWGSDNSETESYIVNVKLLDGEPDVGNDLEAGTSLISENKVQENNSITFTVPAEAEEQYDSGFQSSVRRVFFF